MKFVAGLLGGAVAAFLIACGGGGSGQSFAPGPPPVQAQSGFSNASLNGTYGISFSGTQVSSGSIQYVGDGIGTIQFNGSGSITGGSITNYTSSATCQSTVTSGTYSVSSTGAVTATINGSSSTSGCTSGSEAFSGEVSQNSDTVVFAESDGGTSGSFFSGTAIKQQ